MGSSSYKQVKFPSDTNLSNFVHDLVEVDPDTAMDVVNAGFSVAHIPTNTDFDDQIEDFIKDWGGVNLEE